MSIPKPQLLLTALGALLLMAISAVTGYWLAQSRGEPANTRTPAATRQTPLYWYDPMKPEQHFDRPGRSPFMDMQLVPKYAEDSDRGGASLKIDPGIVENLGIRLTRVERGALPAHIEAVGAVGFNQREIAIVQARSNGFIVRVYGRAPGDVIAKNAPIVDLLVPEWVAAQTEFLALLHSGDPSLIESARQRLMLLGMSPELVARVQSSGAPLTTITVRAPIAGMIDSIGVREGMTLSTGSTIATLNGLSSVWIEAAIPEAQGAFADLGTRAKAQLTAYPGQSFPGRVIAVLPQTNSETRTVRVRVSLDNSDGRLRPGMTARVRFEQPEQPPVVYVASEAVIRTGTRAVVIVAGEQGQFSPREVQTGAELDGQTIVQGGLEEGQNVVASGQFLIDSEASLRGVLARWNRP